MTCFIFQSRQLFNTYFAVRIKSRLVNHFPTKWKPKFFLAFVTDMAIFCQYEKGTFVENRVSPKIFLATKMKPQMHLAWLRSRICFLRMSNMGVSNIYVMKF